MIQKEIIYYLEMSRPQDLCPSRLSPSELDFRESQPPLPEVNRFLYTAVGGNWWWVDRLGWTYRDWLDFLRRPGHETWIAYVNGTPAGYFELEGKEGEPVEILSFGLLPAFVGRGYGGALLTAAVRRAWEKKPDKVWLHTCSFDHPGALDNYKARGFRLVRTEEHLKEMPEVTPGLWPGAHAGG